MVRQRKKAPRVSILLTCFNHLAFLPGALESVRSQTYRDFEVIALDDSSSDGTQDWLKKQSDIRCELNPSNIGTYASLNRGLDLASGELIAILNDDDLWAPDKLRFQVDALDRFHDVGLAHTGGWFIDGDGKRISGNPLGFKFPTFETGDILPDLVVENKIIASAAMFRRECIDEVGAFDPTYFGSGDWQMWFRIAERRAVAFVDGELTAYRIHGDNASHKLERIWTDDVRLREWMADQLNDVEPERLERDRLRRAKAFNLAALGTVRTLTGDALGGRHAYAASMKLQPTRWRTWLRYLASFLPRRTFRKLL